jgi:hypothetical protein
MMIDKDWEEKLMKNTISHGTGFMRMSLNKSGGIDVDVVDPKDYRYWIKEPQIQVAFNSEVVGYVKPQREWVGLTDEEAVQTWEGVIKYAPSDVRIKDFTRAIEAKLKEKNT